MVGKYEQISRKRRGKLTWKTWVFISETVLYIYSKLCMNNVLNLGMSKNVSLMGLNEWHSAWYAWNVPQVALVKEKGVIHSGLFFFASGTNRIKSNSNQTFTDSELVSFSGFRLQWMDLFLLNSSCAWFETCYLINTTSGSSLVAFFICSSSLNNTI